MKNKLLFIIWIFFSLSNSSYSEENHFSFKTQNIVIEENGDILKARNGKAISKDKNLEIQANNFKYSNKSGILEINGNASIILNNEKIKINFKNGIIDTNKNLFKGYDGIRFEDQNGDIIIETEVINFSLKNNELSSNTKSKIYDGNNNIINVNKFNYVMQSDLLKIYSAIITNKENNTLELASAYLNTKTDNLLGKDFIIKLSNKNLSKDSEPRLKGNSISDNIDSSVITKGVFTTCKKTDTCPSWELQANKIIHDKKKKKINYEDAILKFYNYPLVYFPYFSHPDPTVERQSGFLAPEVKSTNNKSYFNLPYYKVISKSKDATFYPRFYNDDQFLLQTEYRSVGDKSKHISDFSFKLDDYKNIKGHYFYEFDKKFTLDKFIDNDFALKLQQTSKDTYLKKNKINSESISNKDIMENSMKFNFKSDNSVINLETLSYEDLNKKDSDRYEYILPSISYRNNLVKYKKLDGNIVFDSKLINKKYNTNVLETTNVNDLKFSSLPKITKTGFYNNYEFLIKNSNSNSKNSEYFKNKENIYLSSLLQFNSSLPLKKNSGNHTSILNPKLALKIAPNYTKDQRKEDINIDVNNLFSLERNVDTNFIEGGVSLAYGAEYKIENNKSAQNLFSLNIANNLRLEESDDLPRSSQIDEKISSILSEIIIAPGENLKINYKNSLKNNLVDINYESLTAKYKINNLITSFDYFNQNDISGKNSYLSNKTELNLDQSNSLIFSTRKNKTIDLTEYYKLSYQYQNDCLAASIEYNKEFYNDRDLKPNEGIFLKLTILPFNNN